MGASVLVDKFESINHRTPNGFKRFIKTVPS